MTTSDFDEKVLAAKPYALKTFDHKAAGKAAFEFAMKNFELAVFISVSKTVKSDGSAGFPEEIIVTRRKAGGGVETISFELERPDYKNNDEGFQGNHLVVAVIGLLREELETLGEGKMSIYTSNPKWVQHCASPEYQAKREHVMFSNDTEVIPKVDSKKRRL